MADKVIKMYVKVEDGTIPLQMQTDNGKIPMGITGGAVPIKYDGAANEDITTEVDNKNRIINAKLNAKIKEQLAEMNRKFTELSKTQMVCVGFSETDFVESNESQIGYKLTIPLAKHKSGSNAVVVAVKKIDGDGVEDVLFQSRSNLSSAVIITLSKRINGYAYITGGIKQ